ncbi:phosphotransferase [Actinoplanes sp. RD1]|uniref:phosphotransferase n=1 Tax=Actinoplanes sp. RD1 TaxID=3064538 RepID=UPI0027421F8C|nr:phosphotransferase [Actinoplanes sp. RD1]
MTRVTRLPAERIAARLGLTYEGPCAGGEVGAAYVRHPDGRAAVLTEGTAAAAPLLATARAAGLPVADYQLVTEVEGRNVVVQSRLPGSPPTIVGPALVDQMITLNERCAGLLTGTAYPQFPLYLRESGPGFCLHETVAAHSPRGAALLAWAGSLGAGELPGDDLVHADYHPGNVLATGDRITGIVDWDNAGRGDRRLGLVTLRYDLELRTPALAAGLDARLRAAVPPEVLRLCWAHMGIRLVDWAIRHHGPADVERWLTVAESGYDI